MREKNRNSIASYCILPQFTTMNVIDGQAVIERKFSLIFYSLTIDNILNIIVLLILVGVAIATLTGDNGILTQAGSAKEKTEIAEEKEIIELAYLQTLGENNEITKTLLSDSLEKQCQKDFVVYKGGNCLYVHYKNVDRYYKVDIDGAVTGPIEGAKTTDKNPGNYTTDIEGKTVAGTETDPYQINSIEDLCAMSNASKSNYFINKYFKVMRDLDFESELSYVNGNVEVSGDIPSCDSVEELMELLTDKNGEGFSPIGTSAGFRGYFDGNNKRIDSIYINRETRAGLFSGVSSQGQIVRISNVIISGNIISTSYAGGIVRTGRKICR